MGARWGDRGGEFRLWILCGPLWEEGPGFGSSSVADKPAPLNVTIAPGIAL